MDFLRAAGIVPLVRSNWELLLSWWGLFTLVLPVQLSLDVYPMGKTSIVSMFNFPASGSGKPTWILMEIVSPLTMLYTVFTNPERNGPLPGSHQWLIFLFCVHYFHRSIIGPLRNPSMAPVHISFALAAVVFNLINGSLIGGWLGGYGSASSVPAWQLLSGSLIWAAGFCGNIYHEEILRNIRRDGPVGKDAEHKGRTVVENDGRIYRVPEGGLFRFIWHPHYFSEWVEWAGYTIAGGGFYNFRPAAMFVVNEIATMLPRALQGKRWYQKKFGENMVPNRKAVIPGLI